ncbi:unnamed protein product [Durusdinium trenchii]|uniref:Uncharacterized protein n=1 Tax=Durusdinium trenchii TaxID=1381693 RepID=A0ABP0SUY3_9DINO
MPVQSCLNLQSWPFRHPSSEPQNLHSFSSRAPSDFGFPADFSALSSVAVIMALTLVVLQFPAAGARIGQPAPKVTLSQDPHPSPHNLVDLLVQGQNRLDGPGVVFLVRLVHGDPHPLALELQPEALHAKILVRVELLVHRDDNLPNVEGQQDLELHPHTSHSSPGTPGPLQVGMSASSRLSIEFWFMTALSTSFRSTVGPYVVGGPKATTKVRADEVPGFLRYGLQVSPGLSVQEDEASDDVRLWDFRIEVALDAQLLEAQELQLTCVAPGCEVLRWKGGCFESRAACDFPDAELVEEDAGSSPSSRSFWQRRHQRLLSAGLSPGEVAEGSSSYAFVFDDDSCDAAVLQPREVLLMARLCAFDTGHQQFTKFDAEERSCPPHLQSSDELIALLTAFHTA